MDNLVIIRSYSSDFDANLALGLLRSHGIDCVLNNEIMAGIFAMPTAEFDQIRLLVRQSDIEEAERVLNSSESSIDNVAATE